VSTTGDFGVGKGNRKDEKRETKTEACVTSEFFLNATRVIDSFII
jgi:hypothetical protein